MMAIYTYVVDHGEDSPSIGAGMEINGGRLTSVCFCDQLENNEKARELIEGVLLDVDQPEFELLERALKLI